MDHCNSRKGRARVHINYADNQQIIKKAKPSKHCKNINYSFTYKLFVGVDMNEDSEIYKEYEKLCHNV